MQLAMVGLGRMGANMVRRLLRDGHEVVVWNRDYSKCEELAKEGARPAKTIEEMVKMLSKPRAAWVMLPSGDVTEDMVRQLGDLLEPGDTVIDGGNSMFKDDVRRAQGLLKKGIDYADVGTSGGVWGLERGYCLMIGGPSVAVDRLEPVFKTLAPGRGDVLPVPSRNGGTAEEGYLHCGPVGAGHFVKMIHNGIEYGMMQALGEGFDILKNANSPALPKEIQYDMNLADIAELWRRGSVVASWLLDLSADALAESPALSQYSGVVQDSGEGRWTVQAAIDEAVPAPVLSAALYARFASRGEADFANRVLSAMRHEFGGHVEKGAPKAGR